MFDADADIRGHKNFNIGHLLHAIAKADIKHDVTHKIDKNQTKTKKLTKQ